MSWAKWAYCGPADRSVSELRRRGGLSTRSANVGSLGNWSVSTHSQTTPMLTELGRNEALLV